MPVLDLEESVIYLGYRKKAEHELAELKKQFEHIQIMTEHERKNRSSEHDESIRKQRYLNDTLQAQVRVSSITSIYLR